MKRGQINLELFSEIYSCYFRAIRKVLEAAQKNPLTYDEITEIINSNAFSESSFFIMPYLQSSEWNLLNRLDSNNLKTPITTLQKSWLKSLLNDKRITLFLDESQIKRLNDLLEDVETLYENSDFHCFDAAADGDRYDSQQYKNNFRTIISAIRYKRELRIEYDSGKGKRSNNCFMPVKLNYSERDDKFRLIAVNTKGNRMGKVVLNLSRIKSVDVSQNFFSIETDRNVIEKNTFKEPIVLQILPYRNALERCMLQFASMEKQTEYDEATDSYICRIFYDIRDESELLIRILSFGPVVKVLGHKDFLDQIRERIEKQVLLV